MDVWLSGPPNTQCQRYLLVPLTMKCATKVTSVEHVPLVGVAVSETTTGAMPVLAPADIGMAGAGAVDVVAVDGDLLGAGPVGALVAGTLVGTPVAGPVTAGRVPVAADPPPDTTWLGWRVAYKPARTMTHASPAAMASRRIGRRRRPGPAPGVVAAGGAACGVRSAVASARSSVGGSPAATGGTPDPDGAPPVPAAAASAPSATASSGCFTAVGERPSRRCSSVVTSGIRLDPPSSSSSPTSSAGVPVAASRSAATSTVRASSRSAADSNASRP